MQTVDINLIPGGVAPVVNVSQFDEGRRFALRVLNGNAEADLVGYNVSIEGKKRDGKVVDYTAAYLVNGTPAVAVDGCVVTITTPMQMTAVAGKAEMKLKLEDIEGGVLHTMRFYLSCDPDPEADGDVSESELPAIIEGARADADRAEAAAQRAEEAAGSGGQSTEEAKAAARAAEASATSASRSASEASTSASNASSSASSAATSASSAATSASNAAGSAQSAERSAQSAATYADADTAFSTTSTKAVQNKVITQALANGQIRFGIDGSGNYGYIKAGADSVTPFKDGWEEVKGNAVAGHVLSGKTFSSESAGSNITGTMTDRGAVSQTLDPGGSYIVPQGYHNGNGTVSARALNLQAKSVSLSTSSSQRVTPDSGNDGLSQVTIPKVSLQSKTASLSTSAQTITPDSGYHGLSRVTVPAVTGTASASDVLSGKTFSSATAGVNKTGTITSRSASSVTISEAKTYSSGYYPNSWTVTPSGGSIEDISMTFKDFSCLGSNATAYSYDKTVNLPTGSDKYYLVFATSILLGIYGSGELLSQYIDNTIGYTTNNVSVVASIRPTRGSICVLIVKTLSNSSCSVKFSYPDASTSDVENRLNSNCYGYIELTM